MSILRKIQKWACAMLVRAVARVLGADVIVYGASLTGSNWLLTGPGGKDIESGVFVDCDISVTPRGLDK